MISVVNEEKVDTDEKLAILSDVMKRRLHKGISKWENEKEKVAKELGELKFEHTFFTTKIGWNPGMGIFEFTEVEFRLLAHGNKIVNSSRSTKLIIIQGSYPKTVAMLLKKKLQMNGAEQPFTIKKYPIWNA